MSRPKTVGRRRVEIHGLKAPALNGTHGGAPLRCRLSRCRLERKRRRGAGGDGAVVEPAAGA